MSKISQNSTYYMRYKDIVKQIAREYYAKNNKKLKVLKKKKSLFKNKKNGLIKKLKRNKIKWEEKQESILKIDIIIILLLFIRFVLFS